MPGVKSIGPASSRVNGRIVSWSGGLPPSRTPGVVFLAAGAFAGHQIRIGAAQAGRFHRLVDVEHDVVLGGFVDHLLMMPDHVLAIVPFAARACRRRRFAADLGDQLTYPVFTARTPSFS